MSPDTMRPMRWLLHGTLTKAVGEAMVRHGHQIKDAAELGLNQASTAEEFLKSARDGQLDLLTADANLVDAVFDKKVPFSRTIVFLQLAGGDVEQDDAVDRFFARYPRPSAKRLYTVTETRVKVRQLPGK
jgi:hypothetical protein